MDAIKSYIESMFKGLPQTEEILRIKEDLLANMEDKFEMLRSEGKKDNEAIGIVISEFGDIDELLEEMNIHLDYEDYNPRNVIDESLVDTYYEAKKTASWLIGIGILLIFIGPSVLITLSMDADNDRLTIFGVTFLLVMVASAIGLFIFSDSKVSPYKYISEEGDFVLNHSTRTYVENRAKEFSFIKTITTVLGVILIILSPTILFISMMFSDTDEPSGLSVSMMVLTVGIAVFILIVGNAASDVFKQLLKQGDYNEDFRRRNAMINTIASVYWPIVTILFLASGFLFGAWHINWLIWPIAGILFGGLSAGISSYQKAKQL